MLRVSVKNGKIENAIKVLKKKVKNTKQNEQLRDRKEYTKPTVKRRDEKNKAIHKQKKNQDV